MEVIQTILKDLNQDRLTVQRIADVVSAHNERQRLQEEEQAKKEEEALKQMRIMGREEEEERQEEVATLNSLVDHYKKEALAASALR